MTKTLVKFSVAMLAICGTLALASMSPVSASDGIDLSAVYLSNQSVSQPQDKGQSTPIQQSAVSADEDAKALSFMIYG